MGDSDITKEGSISPDVVPLTRAGTEEDAGGALLFMCSRAGAYLSQSILVRIRAQRHTDLYRWKYTHIGRRSNVDSAGDLLKYFEQPLKPLAKRRASCLVVFANLGLGIICLFSALAYPSTIDYLYCSSDVLCIVTK